MLSWKQYEVNASLELGIDMEEEAPPVRISYRALDKDGNVHDTDDLAEIRKISKNYVSIKNPADVANQKEFYQQRSNVEAAASEKFHSDLRLEYAYLNDATFYVCYNKAYEDGHSSGYDSVADKMYSVVQFATDILNANK